MWRIEIHSDLGNFESVYNTLEGAISFLNLWNPRELAWVRVSENYEGEWRTRFEMKED